MPGPIANLGAVAGVMVSLAASALGAQQQVKVSVSAVPNPIAAGSCTRIWADVRDELNRALTLENGIPLQWGSYDYSASNGSDFEWRSTASGESELCAKPGVGAVTTQITATVKGTPYSGATVLTVGTPVAGPPQVATATTPATSPGQAPPAQAAVPAQATVPAQPYVPPAPTYAPPAPANGPPAQPAAPPAQGYSPQPATNAPQPAQATAPAQPPAAAPVAAPAPVAEAQPAVKSGGGFFKKIGSHLKQRAAEVKEQTALNLTAAATQVVDTTFQTGTRLVASTTAEVTNTARMGIGGVGQKLMLAPQRGGASADNLALAIASGRAVLLEMRFTPGTDVLEPSARELVRRLAVELRTAMVNKPAAKYVIEGHVDSVPNAQVLSEYRAAAVKVALSSNGVDANRLIALGYGTSRPLQPGGPTARIEIAQTQ